MAGLRHSWFSPSHPSSSLGLEGWGGCRAPKQGPPALLPSRPGGFLRVNTTGTPSRGCPQSWVKQKGWQMPRVLWASSSPFAPALTDSSKRSSLVFLSVNNSCCPLAMYSAHFTYHPCTALRGSDFGGGEKKKIHQRKKKKKEEKIRKKKRKS